jgi:hypothetical protein
MAETAVETDETKPARKKFCVKVYLDKNDEESRNAHPLVDRLEFRFTNKNSVVVKLSEIGKGCGIAAAWHGVAQKIGDAYNKATNADEAQEAAETMLERLVGNEWVKAGEGAGPRIGLLVQAIHNALTKQGEKVDEARLVKIREKVSDKVGRDGAMANAAIEAEYKALQAEAASKRAKEAAGKAKASTDTLEGF